MSLVTISRFWNVACEFDNSHTIIKEIETEIEESEVENHKKHVESVIHIYCPFCNKWSNGKVIGELVNDQETTRD